jgi:hypothetical protein
LYILTKVYCVSKFVPCKVNNKMKGTFPKSIFELLDLESFRKRTAMYLGEKSISKLRTYMDGYQTCETFNGIKSKETKPPFWLFFPWIGKT